MWEGDEYAENRLSVASTTVTDLTVEHAEIKDAEIQKLHDQLKSENAIHTAKAYENENRELRQHIEDEQSQLFRVNQEGDHTGTTNANNEIDIIEKIKRELDDRIAEVEKYRREAHEWRKKFDAKAADVVELQRANSQYRQFIENALSGEAKTSTDENADTPANFVVAKLLQTLRLLEVNNREMSELRADVVTALRSYGYFIDFDKPTVEPDSLRQKCNVTIDPALEAGNVSLADMTANKTLNSSVADMSMDIGSGRDQMDTLRNVCILLFNKLRNTAEFLEQLLETLGETKESRDISGRIQELRLDVDKSVNAANFAATEFEKAEKSMMEFCEVMVGQLVDSTVFGDMNSTAQENDLIDTEYDQLRHEREQLESDVQQLKERKEEGIDELIRLDKSIAGAKKKLGDFGQHLAKLGADIAVAAQHLEELTAKKDDRTQELRTLEAQMNEATQELEILQAGKDEAIRKLEFGLTQKEEVTEQLKLEVYKVNEAIRELDKLRIEKENATQALAKLQAENAKMEELLQKKTTIQKKSETLQGADAKSIGKHIKGELVRIYDSLSHAKASTSSSSTTRPAKKK